MAKVVKFNEEIKKIIDNTKTNFQSKFSFRNIMIKGKIISIPNEISRSWLLCKQIIREKSQLESWGVEFSDKTIDSLLIQFVFKMIHEPEYDLSKSVKIWLDELKKLKIETYVIFRPVFNLLTDLTLDFGKVKILKISEKDILQYYLAPSSEEFFMPKQIADDLVKINKTDVYAIVEAEAKDKEQAEIISQQYLEQALNVIRIFHNGTKVVSADDHRQFIKVANFISEKGNNKISTGWENLHVDIPTQITSNNIAKLQPIWDQIISFLFKDEPNEIESQILTALYWYGEGYKDSNPASSFLKFITALENLLIFDRQFNKTERIASRISTIIYLSGVDREKCFSFMKSYYEIRNDIIHSGKTRVYPEDVEQVRVWTQTLLQKFILKHDTYSKMSELFKKEYGITFTDKQFSPMRKILTFLGRKL